MRRSLCCSLHLLPAELLPFHIAPRASVTADANFFFRIRVDRMVRAIAATWALGNIGGKRMLMDRFACDFRARNDPSINRALPQELRRSATSHWDDCPSVKQIGRAS